MKVQYFQIYGSLLHAAIRPCVVIEYGVIAYYLPHTHEGLSVHVTWKSSLYVVGVIA